MTVGHNVQLGIALQISSFDTAVRIKLVMYILGCIGAYTAHVVVYKIFNMIFTLLCIPVESLVEIISADVSSTSAIVVPVGCNSITRDTTNQSIETWADEIEEQS